MRALIVLLGMLLVIALPAPAPQPGHRLLIHVDSPDAAVMAEALRDVTELIDTLRAQGATVAIEIIADGPGASMLLDEVSPVKDEVRRIHATYANVTMTVCESAIVHAEATLNRPLTVMPEARSVPSCVARIIQLEEQHWTYLKP